MACALSIAAGWPRPAAAEERPALASAPRPKSAAGPVSARAVSPYQPVNLPRHAQSYYGLFRGVDDLSARRTASGNLIRFSYRVTDPAAANALGDRNAKAYMIGLRNHALLQVPVMDKIGQLRQTGSLEVGREYWMVFSNKGNLVQRGDRVSVMVGSFYIEGLVVE